MRKRLELGLAASLHVGKSAGTVEHKQFIDQVLYGDVWHRTIDHRLWCRGEIMTKLSGSRWHGYSRRCDVHALMARDRGSACVGRRFILLPSRRRPQRSSFQVETPGRMGADSASLRRPSRLQRAKISLRQAKTTRDNPAPAARRCLCVTSLPRFFAVESTAFVANRCVALRAGGGRRIRESGVRN
jgi:hypothetical protein